MDARSVIEQKMEAALACIEKAEYQEAVKLLKDVIELDPYEVNAYRLCGQAYFYLCEDDRAISSFNAALIFDRHHESTLVWRGLAYMNKQRFGKAIRDLSEAIKMNPASAYLYQRGISYLALNDCEKALIDIRQVLILEPQDSDAQEKLESCLLAIIENDLLTQFKKIDVASAIQLLSESQQLKINEYVDKKFNFIRHSFWGLNLVSAATTSSALRIKR